MEYFKLQIGCLVFVLYIAFVYLRETGHRTGVRRSLHFMVLVVISVVNLIFDGATAYTVNHLDSVPRALNLVLHLVFLLSLDTLIFYMFHYMLSFTEYSHPPLFGRIFVWLPFAVNVLVLVVNIRNLEFRTGTVTNYSMGVSVYTCYATAAVYFLAMLAVFFRRSKYIESRKRVSIFTFLFVFLCVTMYQMLRPESLISSIGPVMFVLGIYLNCEDPALIRLAESTAATVVDFSTMVENRDDSTGGHVKRTSAYVSLLADALWKRGYYNDVFTKDYMNELALAAPLHDIGKIGVPDSILQKPGRLTDMEFEIMKTHAARGGELILETFGKREDQKFVSTAFDVARHHHEKWNGNGYPDRLRGEEIPLCARIMAVADVFDALSQNRCYRAAMPLDRCFEIIESGRGTDFDPLLVDVFLEIRPEVENVHAKVNS